MKRIVWIASFPKSGNTWIRLLLSKYFDPRKCDEIDINDIRIGGGANARQLFDEFCLVEASDVADHEIDEYRCEVFRALGASASAPVFLKTHERWRLTPTGGQLFPDDATLAVIYVIRNPLDVAVSFAAHMNMTLGDAVDRLCDPELTLGGSNDGGISMRLAQQVGSWSCHVRSWTELSQMSVAVVRYEDLHSHPTRTLASILTTLGVRLDADRLRRSVDACAFTHLQQQERERGFGERVSRAEMFFRGGRVGDGLRVLAPALRQRLAAEHSAVMSRFGYLAGDRRPIRRTNDDIRPSIAGIPR